MPGRTRWPLLALVAGLVVVVVIAAYALVDARSRTAPAAPATASAPAAGETATATPATTPSADENFYASRTPYPVPTSADRAGPAGYEPVFLQHLGRHGARTATPGDHGDRAGRLWRRASEEGALTPLGVRLGPALADLDAATDRLGLGRLTATGRDEQEGLGRRTGTRLADLWASAGDDDEVDVVTSGRTRTQQSAQAFVTGLTDVEPRLHVEEPRTDRRLLYFDSTDPAYRKFLADDQTWRRAYATATRGTDLEAATRQVLEGIYAPSFVAALDDPLEEVESLYERYRSVPSLAEDVGTPVDLAPFFPASVAAQLAFVEDTRYFYARGPGITGDDRAHRAAQVLVDDFLAAAQRRLDGGHDVAVLQFAHAEEVGPLAALLELPGNRPLASADQVYSWADSDYRTAKTLPLSATIDWTVWRDASGSVLVSVEQNEEPTTLGRTCREAQPGYYQLAELRRCLAAR